MKTVQRKVTTGNTEGTYALDMPENVAEFIHVLSEGDKEATVTVNVAGLMRLAEYAMKAYLIEQDNRARIALKSDGITTPKKDRFSLGF